MGGAGWVVLGQAITNPISGPNFDFTFTIGPELDNFSVREMKYWQLLQYRGSLSNNKFLVNVCTF